jgi:glutaconate CoA-transferase subunit A
MSADFLSLDAAAAQVEDGMTIAFGGLSLYRRPVSFVRALLRRNPRPRNLTLACFTAGFESDLLVGAGCVSTVRTVYFGLEAFGFAPMFTEFAGRGDLTVIEETEASFALGLRARAAGISFLPARAWLGTDLPDLRPDVKTVDDPYTGEKLMAFPAIPIDIAVLHGLAGDRYGNILLNNNLGVDLELCSAADRVITTVETTVERIERERDGFVIPAPGSDYIALAPNGAYPTSCYPKYPIRGGELMRYVDACAAGEFARYLEEFLQAEG